MDLQPTKVACIALLAVLASGCGKDAATSPTTPLTATECQQLKDKQVSLLSAEMEKQFPGKLDGVQLEADADCSAKNEKARMQYECMMSAKTIDENYQCEAAHSGG